MYFSKKFPCEHLVLERCLWVWQVLERWYHWHESHHWQSLRDWSRWSEENAEEEWFCWESLSSDSSQHPQHHWLSRDPWLVWRILRSLEEQTTGENHLKHEDIINYIKIITVLPEDNISMSATDSELKDHELIGARCWWKDWNEFSWDTLTGVSTGKEHVPN